MPFNLNPNGMSEANIDIRVGNVMRLKSGGPAMTIGALGRDETAAEVAICYWLDDEGQPASYQFPLVCLRPY